MVGGLRTVRPPARIVVSVRATFAFGILLLLLFSLASQPLPTARAAGGITYTVNSTNDPGDGVCTAAECTLREAILAANAHTGRDTIIFAFSGTPPFTIRPTSPLPPITDSVVLDALGTKTEFQAAVPTVELDGSATTDRTSGLDLQAPDCLVRGFIINRFPAAGVFIRGNAEILEWNYIGTDATGTLPRGNGFFGGVFVGPSNSNQQSRRSTIGPGNRIAFNAGSGVFGTNFSLHFPRVRGNVIFANGGPAIDLNNYGGIDANPSGVFRAGLHPVLTGVTTNQGTTTVRGVVEGSPGFLFDLDFYASEHPHPSGHGDAEVFLGTSTVTPDASGFAEFDITLPVAVPEGHFVAATQIDEDGATSEFSVALPVGRADCHETHETEGGISPLWAARFNGRLVFNDRAPRLAVSPDGAAVYMAGNTLSELNFGANTATLVSYDAATGAERWTAVLEGTTERPSAVRGLVVSPDGARVFIAIARAVTEPFGVDYATAAFDATSGARLWLARPARDPQLGCNGEPRGLAISPDGQRVYVTGFRCNDGPNTFAHDAVSGAELWSSRVGGSLLALSRDGQRLHLGLSTLDSLDGHMLWTIAPPNFGIFAIEDVAVSPDGDIVILTGVPLGTMALAADTGALLWSATPNSSGQRPSRLAVSPDGRFVCVAGSAFVAVNDFGAVDEDIVVSALDAVTGQQHWQRQFAASPTGKDFPEGIAVSPDSRTVAVTGWSDRRALYPLALFDIDYVTVAFDSETGDRRFLAHLDGAVHGNDFGAAVRFGPTGDRLFVTGSSQGCGTGRDFVTVAYTLCATAFSDVPCDYWALRFINAAAREHLVSGFGDGTYRPDRVVARAEMAVMLARAADRISGDFAAFVPPACGAESFTDVPCTHFAYRFVEYLVSKTILPVAEQPIPFQPNDPTTRRAMAGLLALLRNLEDGDFEVFTPPICGNESFNDVLCTDDDYKVIEYLRVKGIVAGFADGTFRPGAPVTRAQMAVFLLRALNIEP